ncbi:MAG: ABC transporter permease [Candidatus Omnitrophica bacterium]|nr:ABC transporter permease [Candidatus Omnitrophota bacterium]
MRTFLKIAWRNIIRSKWRSLITIAAIAFGLAALIFIRAFVEGADRTMIENYTDLIPGHLQIHKIGFHKKMGLERSILAPEKLIEVIKAEPEVVNVTRRIKDYCLVSSSEHSSGVLLMGIDPSTEPQVSYLHKRIRHGEYLSKDKDDQIILGKVLAEILNVELGDKVVIMGQAADGSLASGAYRLCGILDTGAEEIDKTVALITLKAAQQLLVMEGKISELTLRIESVYNAADVSQKLKAKIDTKEFEVLTWKEISPLTAQWLEFDRAFINYILFIVLLVVASGIFNTLLMSVLERIREFGIMLALGTKRIQIVLMVALESLILGVIGSALGVTIGVAVSLYFGSRGVNLGKFASALENYYTGSIIYPRLYLDYVVGFSLIVLITSVLVSFYPAWRAANLKPVEAIKHF